MKIYKTSFLREKVVLKTGHKRCSASPAIGKCKSKPPWDRCHFTTTGMSVIRKADDNCWQRSRDTGTFIRYQREHKWCSSFGKHSGSSSTGLTDRLYDPTISILAIYKSEMKTCLWKVLYINSYSSLIYDRIKTVLGNVHQLINGF